MADCWKAGSGSGAMQAWQKGRLNLNQERMENMFEDVLPKRKIGYIYPRHVVDTLPYELYHILPDRIMMVMCPVSLKKFTREDVDHALAPLDKYLKMLVGRKVDIIVHGGVPLTLFQGCKEHDDMLVKINKTTGLPATSTTEVIVTAAKSLGIKNIAVTNKWSPEMNQSLNKYFERKGIQVAGTHFRSMELEQFENMEFEEHTALIYELARETFKRYPEADGLYIGGGSMVSYPIIAPLEEEFGKPVVINCAALSWGLCHLLDCWTPVSGYGRLLESL
jgi:maleate cis-trans isomerase